MIRTIGLGMLAIIISSSFSYAALPARAWDFTKNQEIAIPSGEKATVFVFVSPECPCSKSHEPKLKTLFEQFSQKGVAFVGVDSYPGNRTGESENHFASAQLPFPVIRDTSLEFANHFGAQKTPHAFIVKNGEIVYSGGVDSSQSAASDAEPFLETAITQVISGSHPQPSKTRALGCVISRSL